MCFRGSPGNFKQILFLEFFFFFFSKFFFAQNFFSPLKTIFPLSIFYAFLDVLCHPECSKNFSPKIFLGEARCHTMLPSISSFHSKSRTVKILKNLDSSENRDTCGKNWLKSKLGQSKSFPCLTAYYSCQCCSPCQTRIDTNHGCQ